MRISSVEIGGTGVSGASHALATTNYIGAFGRTTSLRQVGVSGLGECTSCRPADYTGVPGYTPRWATEKTIIDRPYKRDATGLFVAQQMGVVMGIPALAQASTNDPQNPVLIRATNVGALTAAWLLKFKPEARLKVLEELTSISWSTRVLKLANNIPGGGIGISDAVLAVLLVGACYTDLRTGKIKNALTFPVMLVGLVLAPVVAPHWMHGLAGLGVAFAVGAVLWRLGGAYHPGDVKLVMAAGALVGPETILRGILLGLVLNLPVAVTVLAVRGRLGNFFRFWLKGDRRETTRMVFGPVIAAGIDSVLGRRPPARVLAALVAALAGLAMLVLGSPPDGDASFSVVGALFGVGAGACYAVYTLLCKRLLDGGWSGTWTMAWSFVVAAVLGVAFVVPSSLDWLGTPSGPVTVAYLGLATISVAYLLYARSLSRLTGSTVVTLTLVEPVTATTLGALVLGENIRPVSWAGAAIVVAALVVAGTSTS